MIDEQKKKISTALCNYAKQCALRGEIYNIRAGWYKPVSYEDIIEEIENVEELVFQLEDAKIDSYVLKNLEKYFLATEQKR